MELTPMAGRRAIRENALIDIFMAKRPRLVQMATRIIGCQCLAEDVVQETMLKICEGGPQTEVQSPTAYLFRMVRNLAIDCARRRSREQHLDTPEEGGPELMTGCPCPETTMARCQALRIVMAALQELPERTRHAFELHRIEGVSQRDIASRLKVSPTLVNFMVRDAHNHCRSKLLSHEMDEEIVPAPAGRAAQEGGEPSPRSTGRSRLTDRGGRKARSAETARRAGEPVGGNSPAEDAAQPETAGMAL